MRSPLTAAPSFIQTRTFFGQRQGWQCDWRRRFFLLPHPARLHGSSGQRRPVSVRHPGSVRVWLYVLDCLSGYLQSYGCASPAPRQAGNACQRWSHAWNFGSPDAVEVQAIVEKASNVGVKAIGSMRPCRAGKKRPFARLNWEKAAQLWLCLPPLYTWDEAVQKKSGVAQAFVAQTALTVQLYAPILFERNYRIYAGRAHPCSLPLPFKGSLPDRP